MPGDMLNQPREVQQRWQTIGDQVDVQRYATSSTQEARTANTLHSQSDAAISDATGVVEDQLFSLGTTAGTSGIGILRRTGAAVLKVELQAMESLNLNKIISNPKVFTLDNQLATVTQGEEIPYQTTSDGTTSTSFKEAALKLEVTPSIIGDGNVLLNIKVNNDTPNRSSVSEEPPINKMEIVTKLLVADGDIVVIGGIKKNILTQNKAQTPGMGNVPVIGNLFKNKQNSDNLDELLVFIAPRIL